MRALRALTLALAASLVPVANAQATLIDLGNGMVYDSIQDLTWLKDTAFAGPKGTQETQEEAEAYADMLVFSGFSDWRLPRYFGGTSPERSSEIARLLEPLGWVWNAEAGEYDWNAARGTGPFLGFTQVGVDTFWLGGSYNLVWHSLLAVDPIDDTARTWVVRDGHAGTSVPEPSTLLLLGAGSLGIALNRRLRERRRRARQG